MKKVVMGIVETRLQAESIISALETIGIRTEEVSVLFPDKNGRSDFAHEHNTKAPEGAVAGVGTGGVLGGTLGLLAGIGALAIPGFGPLIAAGPLLAALSGAAAGAAVGGLAGALVGMGIPEIEAKQYEGKLLGGNILLAVHIEKSAARKQVEDIMRRAGAHDITSTTEASVPKRDDVMHRR